MVTKGNKVCFLVGKYAGKKGWINLDGGERNSGDTIGVIVNLHRRGEKVTYVYPESIQEEATTQPTSYAEAILEQCPDVDAGLTKICRDLAKCNIKRDSNGIFAVIQRKLNEAVVLQESKGSKALYRHIDYNAPVRTNANDMETIALSTPM